MQNEYTVAKVWNEKKVKGVREREKKVKGVYVCVRESSSTEGHG
jgi:hypothetical protein